LIRNGSYQRGIEEFASFKKLYPDCGVIAFYYTVMQHQLDPSYDFEKEVEVAIDLLLTSILNVEAMAEVQNHVSKLLTALTNLLLEILKTASLHLLLNDTRSDYVAGIYSKINSKLSEISAIFQSYHRPKNSIIMKLFGRRTMERTILLSLFQGCLILTLKT